MELGELAGMGGLALVVAVVEGVKGVWPEMPGRLKVVGAVVAGVGVNLAVMRWSGVDAIESVVVGAVVGLAAAGVYRGLQSIAGVER